MLGDWTEDEEEELEDLILLDIFKDEPKEKNKKKKNTWFNKNKRP